MAEPNPFGATGSVPSEPSSPPAIPDHQLLRCIGRGSYGEVWLARHGGGDFRALKVVYRKTFEHDRPFERELSGIEKFEPISRSHPSQVSILQVGRNREAGYFYYVMELADDANDYVQGPKSKVQSPKSDVQSPGLSSGAAGPSTSDLGPSTLDFGPRTLDPVTYSPRSLKSELVRRHRFGF